MGIPRETLAAALNAETERQSIEDAWRPAGSGFGMIHRAVAGLTLVEFDYDYPAHLGDIPRWVAIVWRSATAFETDAENGKLAVIYCEAPSPSGFANNDDALPRLARFAVGSLRLAAAVELVCEGEAGQTKPE